MFNTAFPLYNGAATDKLAAQNDGKRIDGMFLMFGGLVKKFGYALTTLFIGLGLKWGGYDGSLDVQSSGALMTLKIMFIYVPLFFGIVCLYYSIRRMDFEKE
ncbi:MAG: MFS transporter [Firmicutes bacterium]|nr:MFS transporter [Bacillota bacterium]